MTIANTLSFLQNSAGALTTGTINANGAPVTVSISGSEKIRVDTNGYLLVNYTSSVGSYHLQVQGNAYISGALTVGSLTAGALTGSITTATSLAGGVAGQLHYQISPGLSGFVGPGTAGQVLISQGSSAPIYTNASNIGAGSVNTILQTANATYFPTFVDSNNASATAETVYTTSSFLINPITGAIGINGIDSTWALTVKTTGNLGGTINNFQKVWTSQASGGSSNNVYVSEWRRRRATGTDWTTQNIHDGVWVDASFTNPGSDTRTWWERDPNTPSQSWGDQATTWMFANSSGLFLTGGSAQLNAGFTNKLNIIGSIVSGSSASTNGSILMQGQYGANGSLTNFGTEYSSGGPSIGYACYPSNAAAGAFFSSYNAGAIGRAALNVTDAVKWYTGSSQNIAIGSALTMTEKMRLSNAGGLSVGTATDAVAGEIRASNEITAYYTSDVRLKENVVVIKEPIKKLEQIRGVYFDWTDEHVKDRGGEDGYFVRKHDIGVIAQEVEAILPEIVATRDNGYKAVKYEKIVPLLIECIKEQQTQINQILEKLEKLANK